MRLFKYNSQAVRSITDMYKIYLAVRDLENYARKIYKNRWEDALDIAFFHVLQNFDASKGDLDNYVTKVVSGILLGEFKKEYPYEYIADLKADDEDFLRGLEKQAKDTDASSVEGCMKYLAPMYVQDFKFFETMSGQYRKGTYTGLFKKYEVSTIKKAVEELNKKYGNAVKEIYRTKKKCGGKPFNGEVNEKNYDKNCTYIAEMNDTVLYRRVRKNSVERFIYSLDMDLEVDKLILRYYNENNPEVEANVMGNHVYCTLTGKLAFSIADLREKLKKDIVGIIIARTHLKLLHYNESEALFLSISELQYDVNVKFLGEDVWFRMNLKPSKELGAVTCSGGN